MIANMNAQKKQTSIADYLFKRPDVAEGLHASTSVTTIRTITDKPPMRSSSTIQMVSSNMTRNKCIAKKQCRYCPNLNTTGNITCTVTGKTYPTKINITCRSSNLIYCITCRKCKIQYIGQTKRTLMERFQGHFGKVKSAHKEKGKDPYPQKAERFDPIGHHFSTTNHTANDIEIHVIAFITLSPQSADALTMRLRVERKWIHLMRCPAPTGLNIFD